MLCVFQPHPSHVVSERIAFLDNGSESFVKDLKSRNIHFSRLGE